MSNFITDCIEGNALMTDVDDYIDMWHESDSNLSLHDFLGMTEKEYKLFVEDESYLGSIITAHKFDTDIASILKKEYALAARSDDPAKAIKIQKWLENEELWD